MTTKKWFLFAVVFAFAAALCVVSIDSYWADTHKANTYFWIGSFVFGLTAAFGMYKAAVTSGSNKFQ